MAQRAIQEPKPGPAKRIFAVIGVVIFGSIGIFGPTGDVQGGGELGCGHLFGVAFWLVLAYCCLRVMIPELPGLPKWLVQKGWVRRIALGVLCGAVVLVLLVAMALIARKN